MESKKSTEYDGYSRTLYKKYCLVCKADMWAPKHVDKKFCSRECTSKFSEDKVDLICFQCEKSFKRQRSKNDRARHGFQFCSRECKDFAQSLNGKCENIRPKHYGLGLSRYRKRALDTYGSICNECGYKENTKMLDVDHISSDRNNNSIENLQVLCVWCHALKTRNVNLHNWDGHIKATDGPLV